MSIKNKGIEGRVADKMLERAAKGLEKYGVSVEERDDLSVIEWLTHLQEELMDGAVYIEKLKSVLGEVDETSTKVLYHPEGMNSTYPLS